MNLPQEIKKRRLEMSINQEQLAKKVGVTQASISDWEKGKYVPRFKVLMRLSKVLKFSIKELKEAT